MKIAFWSSAREGSGVTSNLACISIASAMEYSYRSLLIENHYQKNSLGRMLMYQQAGLQNKVKKNRYGQTGMDYIINEFLTEQYYNDYPDVTVKAIQDKLLGEEEWTRMSSSNFSKDNKEGKPKRKLRKEKSQILKEASLEILSNCLYYIPNNIQINHHTFDYNLYGNIKNILEASDTFADITYIDTSYENNLSSKIILEEVDLVVVNLIQNGAMLEYFFENYSSILNKSVFLISNYNKNSKLNINKISKKYLIDKSNIVAIPYNIDYREAVKQGTVIEFLWRNYSCKRKDPNYSFVKEVKKAVNMIIKNANNLNREEIYP